MQPIMAVDFVSLGCVLPSRIVVAHVITVVSLVGCAAQVMPQSQQRSELCLLTSLGGADDLAILTLAPSQSSKAQAVIHCAFSAILSEDIFGSHQRAMLHL